MRLDHERTCEQKGYMRFDRGATQCVNVGFFILISLMMTTGMVDFMLLVVSRGG